MNPNMSSSKALARNAPVVRKAASPEFLVQSNSTTKTSVAVVSSPPVRTSTANVAARLPRSAPVVHKATSTLVSVLGTKEPTHLRSVKGSPFAPASLVKSPVLRSELSGARLSRNSATIVRDSVLAARSAHRIKQETKATVIKGLPNKQHVHLQPAVAKRQSAEEYIDSNSRIATSTDQLSPKNTILADSQVCNNLSDEGPAKVLDRLESTREADEKANEDTASKNTWETDEMVLVADAWTRNAAKLIAVPSIDEAVVRHAKDKEEVPLTAETIVTHTFRSTQETAVTQREKDKKGVPPVAEAAVTQMCANLEPKSDIVLEETKVLPEAWKDIRNKFFPDSVFAAKDIEGLYDENWMELLKQVESGVHLWGVDGAVVCAHIGEEHLFRRKAELFRNTSCVGVREALESLNSCDGHVACPEGFCIVFSERNGAYVLCRRSDKVVSQSGKSSLMARLFGTGMDLATVNLETFPDRVCEVNGQENASQ